MIARWRVLVPSVAAVVAVGGIGLAPLATASTAVPAKAGVAKPATAGRAAQAFVTSLEHSVHYDVGKLGYRIVLNGGRSDLLGETDLRSRTITIFKRTGESQALLVKTLAFELGHAVDFTYNTTASRAAYLKARHAKRGTTWFAPDLAPETRYGSGDFADVFSDFVTGSGMFSSAVAGRPSAAQLKTLAKFFHRGQPVPKTPVPHPSSAPTLLTNLPVLSVVTTVVGDLDPATAPTDTPTTDAPPTADTAPTAEPTSTATPTATSPTYPTYPTYPSFPVTLPTIGWGGGGHHH